MQLIEPPSKVQRDCGTLNMVGRLETCTKQGKRAKFRKVHFTDDCQVLSVYKNQHRDYGGLELGGFILCIKCLQCTQAS